MRAKLHQTLISTASPLLHSGEQAEAAGRGRVGRISVKARLAVAAASAIASGGASYMSVNQKTFYVLLTNQRLLLLESHWLTFRPVAKIVLDLPRAALEASNLRRGFMVSFQVSVPDQTSGVLLTFPRSERADADALAAALGLAPA